MGRAQMPSHNHTATTAPDASGSGDFCSGWAGTGQDPKYLGTHYTGGSTSHTHSFSGASRTIKTLPPYYSLAFIMQLA